jgi:Fe-S-cluster containining protein
MSLPACCMDMDIDIIDLMIPERMGPDGWAFYVAHGLDRLTLEQRVDLLIRAHEVSPGTVKLRHRCAQLQDDGLCGIYETRPAICRAFDCATRRDCACGGQGIIPVGDLVFDNA